jgi:hypothetical protein
MTGVPDRKLPAANQEKLYEGRMFACTIDDEFFKDKGVDAEVHMYAIAVLAAISSVRLAKSVEEAQGVLEGIFQVAKSGIPSTFALKMLESAKQ